MKNLWRKITTAKSVFFSTLLFSQTNLFTQGSCASPDGSFFGYDGSNPNYVTADANGWCYNNLNPGQTYCWTYLYPSSGNFKLRVIKNESCGNCDGTVTLIMPTACSGGCSSVGTLGCGMIQYNSSCAVQEVNNIEHGGSGSCTPAQSCGTIFTMCITVPAGCTTMDVCPMVYCTAGPGNCTGIMPIELISFTGKNVCEKNILLWTSASETNNNYYTLQKSIDGINFSLVASVEGAGNSSTSINYEFADTEASNETMFYRLKQTDFDGKSETFKPIALIKDCGNKISIPPTLTDGIVSIYSGSDHSESIVFIFDAMGKKIITSHLEKGISNLMINLGSYSKGLYTVFVSTGKENISQKVVLK